MSHLKFLAAMFFGLAMIGGCATTPRSAGDSATHSALDQNGLSLRTEIKVSPDRAGIAIASTFNDFGFRSGDGLFPAVTASDHFFAVVRAKTASNSEITATCRWKNEHTTTVELSSNFPVEQTAVVWKQICDDLKKAATQPAAKDE